MVVKHNTSWWNLKKYAKKLLFKASFGAFGAQKEVVEPTNLVLNPRDSDQRCLFII